MEAQIVKQIEQKIGYHFENPELLAQSLMHSSIAMDRLSSNERLEFLGDSVLALVICQSLYETFPDYLEGDLTKIKSMIVSRKTCSKVANELGLGDYIATGKGMSNKRAMTGSISAGALEAVIAAVYFDGGFEAAKSFILRIFGPLLEAADAKEHQDNYKSVLQQHAQQEFNETPMYELLDEKGPDHNKCFETGVVINGKRFPSAWGVTKKEAEQKAAFNALVELGIVDEDDFE